MRPKSAKFTPLILGSFIVLLFGVALFWPRPPRTIIALSNGDKYEFAGITFGTNHVFGAGNRFLTHLPPRIADAIRKHTGIGAEPVPAFQTDKASLVVWFRPLYPVSPGNTPFAAMKSRTAIQTRLANSDGAEGGLISGTDVKGITQPFGEFTLFPPRSRMLRMNIYEVSANGETNTPIGHVTFRNPVSVKSPVWQADSLPAVAGSGDLRVRLEGMSNNLVYPQEQSPIFGYLRGPNWDASFRYSIESPSAGSNSWVLGYARLNDPAGNVFWTETFDGFQDWIGSNVDTVPPKAVFNFLHGTPWPDRSASRLTLFFKRASDFDPATFVIFTNVPIPAIRSTIFTPITNFVGGRPIVLNEFQHSENALMVGDMFVGSGIAFSSISFKLSQRPNDLAVDLVKLDTDAGNARIATTEPAMSDLFRRGPPPDSYSVLLEFIPTNASTMNLTLVIQKMRSVDFYVKCPPPESSGQTVPY